MKHQNSADKWGFLMIKYDTPEIIKDLFNKIPEDELYTEEGSDDYGFEKQTHVTLTPCLDNDIKLEDLKKVVRDIDEYKIIIPTISCFDTNELFDVLKCDASSEILHKSNKEILDKFESHSEFKEYHPHVTIAYMKKGKAKKYTRDSVSPLVILKPKCFIWSYHNKKGENKIIEWS